MIKDITLIVGFIMSLLGGAGMDGNGKMFVVAVIMVLAGCGLMWAGSHGKEYYG